jgi:hypothetical protein
MHTQNKSTFDLSLQFSSQIYSIVTVTKYIPLLQLPNIKSGRRGRVRMDW